MNQYPIDDPHDLLGDAERRIAALEALNAELLEALKNIVNVFEKVSIQSEALEGARAAIAKAEGEA